jgi:hypothetical protein
MVLASYQLPDGDGSVTVSSLSGDGGGLLANVNRWRNQIQLPPLSGDQLSEVTGEIDVSTGAATLVDLVNDDQRMLVVVVPHQGRSWFLKALGDAATISREKEAFLNFARSAQY